MSNRRIRIGIDTGGTFTDVVAFDEETGELVTTKTPSTPGNPADGFLAGIDKVLGPRRRPHGDDDRRGQPRHHGGHQPAARGQGRRLGFITTEGYEAMLEIARQSVPDGYGNSYFWVKPDRIVPRDLVRGVGGRLDHTGAEVRPFDEEAPARPPAGSATQGINTLGVCFLHAYANPDHEERMRAILRAEHPDAVVSISSEVLREYREYERAMTTLVDAAVKPKRQPLRHQHRRPPGRLRRRHRACPFYVMKSNGGVLSADEVVHQPITTVLSGPAAGALGRRADRARSPASTGSSPATAAAPRPTSRVVIDGEPTLTTEGTRRRLPVARSR